MQNLIHLKCQSINNMGWTHTHVHTVLFKCITNKNLPYSTWNYVQCYVAVWMGGEFGEAGICVWPSPFILHLHSSMSPNYHDVVNWLCVHLSLRHIQLCDPKDCSPSDSSVHGILQVRTLGWVAIPFSRGSSWLPVQFSSVQLFSCVRLFATR